VQHFSEMRHLTVTIAALCLCLAASLPVPVAVGDNPLFPKKGPVIPTTYGPVQGHVVSVLHDDDLTIYRAIPFAAPPLGALRWKSPEPPQPWSKPIFSRNSGPMCPQFDFVKGMHFGAEDCLHLDIYVPKVCTTSTPCAVMQWIYGGAWTVGDVQEFGVYDASKLAGTPTPLAGSTACVRMAAAEP